MNRFLPSLLNILDIRRLGNHDLRDWFPRYRFPQKNEVPISAIHRDFVPASPWLIHLALIAVQVFFGLSFVVNKLVMGQIPPMGIAALRVGFAAPVLLAMAWYFERAVPHRGDLLRLAFLGLTGVFLNQVLFLVGLNMSSATDVSILITATPVFTAMVGVLFGVEAVSRAKRAGIGLAVAGALIMLNVFEARITHEHLLGNVLVTLNALAYAIYMVFQRPLLRRLPPLTVTAWSFVTGSVLVIPVAFRDLLTIQWAVLPTATYLGVAYILIFMTVVNYALITWAIRQSSPTLAATYTTLQPVACAIPAVLVLGEHITSRKLLGFAFIVAGIATVALSRRGETQPMSSSSSPSSASTSSPGSSSSSSGSSSPSETSNG